jgi:hypothetical protein
MCPLIVLKWKKLFLFLSSFILQVKRIFTVFSRKKFEFENIFKIMNCPLEWKSQIDNFWNLLSEFFHAHFIATHNFPSSFSRPHISLFIGMS